MELEQTSSLPAKSNIVQTIQKEVIIPRSGCSGHASVPFRVVRRHLFHNTNRVLRSPVGNAPYSVGTSTHPNFVPMPVRRKYVVFVCDRRAKQVCSSGGLLL